MTRSISSICCDRWRRQGSPSRSSEWERRTISPERSPSWRRTTAATSAALAKCAKMHLGSPGIGEADGAPALDQRSYQTFRTVHRFRSRGLFASDPYRSTIVCRLRQSNSRHCCRAGRNDRPSWLGAVRRRPTPPKKFKKDLLHKSGAPLRPSHDILRTFRHCKRRKCAVLWPIGSCC
jgi:hypothetical protein